MSYQVLARKYRPKSFETLVGQEHVVRALSHALEQQRLHHAYLFTGTRGVGKTTLSRILAKAFNCEKGITAQPCGVCGACTAIDAGRFVDYIEMDAASNRGVDEMAALLEQAVYAPSNARFKVYMIDEVHMLTNHAFNSMLKTLEEPPEHVKFILATTDPQKIPVTVLSRCLQFNLKQMPPGHIVSHLENILGQEQIECDVPALRLLAQGAHGSMRDALSLTDQAIAYAAGRVTLDAVQSMLGALDQSYLLRLLDGLALKEGKMLLDVADEMAARSLSYKAALQDLGTLLHQIAVAQMVPAALADDLPERVELMRFADLFGKEEIQLYYQIVVHGRNELGLAPDEYAGFSMTLLRMLAFRPSSGGAEQSNDGSKALSERRSTVPVAAADTGIRSVSNVAATSVSPERASMPAAGLPAAKTFPPAQMLTNPPVNVDTPRAGLSPAMAALAAARAGSNKAMSPASVPKIAPPVIAANESAVPVLASASVTAPPLRVARSAVVAGEVASEAAGMDDLPPPWDDYEDHTNAATSRREPELQSVLAETAAAVVTVAQAVEIQAFVQHAPASVVEVATATVCPLLPMPVTELNWDGHWPNLAASLPLRGVAQQLVQQSELVKCEVNGNAVVFRLKVPLPTLLSAGSVDKLIAALTEYFQREIRVETEIGAVEQTANAQAMTERAARQVRAENALVGDSFVQTLMREFGASIVTGSIKPI
jgi:DNA polymerase-3 subunit gamma/tau